LVLPPVASFESPNDQAAGKSAEGDVVYDRRNWSPSLALCHRQGLNSRKRNAPDQSCHAVTRLDKRTAGEKSKAERIWPVRKAGTDDRRRVSFGVQASDP